ncbi:complex I NDUFA9 subunit family protein [Candidatus Aquarickettsia rohweri]|uniref:Complex I NDUFA9 subunit family protein n=1 Tax=Candidatus Aquarickettsia rohweri TaxID=2602574 RepID=A0A3R9XPF4_9RICK|nr:complex I NDUFA9 subunit family protein [Candidatus Aquarickettsia rohweri]RST65973.1 complex I NDUFA9 subunit family protein [Candidatus Aquarickettsia rohweri]
MIKEKSTITVFGGSGFIGANLVKKLAKLDFKINLVQSHNNEHNYLYIHGFPGQICNIKFENTKQFYEEIFSNTDYIINLIGILRESNDRTFRYSHIDIPKNISTYANNLAIKKLIHISSLGIEKTCKFSEYAKTKLKGEKVILKNYSKATIIRPSVVFGNADKFINNLIKLIRTFPFFPLVNKGHVFFQPIFVEDLTDIIIKILLMENTDFYGKIYEVGGPDKLTLLQIVNEIYKALNQSPRYFSINHSIMKIISYLSKLIKSFPINPEEVDLLLINNIINNENLADKLKINTTPLNFFIQKQLYNITS